MTPSQQVKLFARQHGMNINSAGNTPMVSKKFPAGAMWIECFDNYKDALEFFTKHQNAYVNNKIDAPWSKPNYK